MAFEFKQNRGQKFAFDPFWNNVSLALNMESPDYSHQTVLSLPFDGDPHAANVALGLYMNGANDGTAFTDVTGKVVTRSGNVVTKTGEKRFGTASAFFDGSTDRLNVGSSGDFTFLTNLTEDYTVECWAYLTNTTNFRCLLQLGDNGPALPSFTLLVQQTTGLLNVVVGRTDSSTGSPSMLSTVPVPLNKWFHACVMYNTTTEKVSLYLNGILQGEASKVGTFGAPTTLLRIGAYENASNFSWAGYIDDVRITRGVVRYTGNFSPYQYQFPYPNIWAEATAKTATANGNVTINSAQSKFGGYSAFFDGTGDALTFTDSEDFNLGSGDFTIECWFYETASKANGQLVGQHTAQSITNSSFLLQSNNRTLAFGVYSGEVSYGTTYNTQHALNTWHHVAVTRSGNTFRMFLDGTQIDAFTQAITLNNSTKNLCIGAVQADVGFAGQYYQGHIDDLRIIKGAAKYTSSFTPPTQPLQYDLTPPDQKSSLPVWYNGGVGLISTQRKYGTTSAFFDGVDDYLYLADSDSWNFGSGDFTIECWFRQSASTPGNFYNLVTQRNSPTDDFAFAFYVSGNGAVTAVLSTTGSSQTHIVSANHVNNTTTFHHVALVRRGSSMVIYLDGVAGGTVANIGGNSLFNSTAPLRIGTDWNGTSSQNPFNGYIDDLRITKGVAKYVYPFEPPSHALPIV